MPQMSRDFPLGMPPPEADTDRGRGGLGGGEPDIGYDQVNALLQQFGGLGLPAPNDPTGFFERMPWMGQKHPRLAAGLDNALIALSSMGEPSETIGGNISNVARGLMGIQPTREMQRLSPILSRLKLAGAFGDLEQGRAKTDLMKAQAEFARARDDIEANKAEKRLNAALIRANIAGLHEGYIGEDGAVYLPDVDETGKVEYKKSKLPPGQFARKRVEKMFGGGVEGAIIAGNLPPFPKDPAEQQGWWARAREMFLEHKKASAGVFVAGAGERQFQSQWVSAQDKAFNEILNAGISSGGRDKRREDYPRQIYAETANPEKFKKRYPDAPPVDDPEFFAWAMKQFDREEQTHRGRLQSLREQFNSIPVEEQINYGGIIGFLRLRGYNPETGEFGPVTGPNLAPQASKNFVVPGRGYLGPIPPGVMPPGKKPLPF